MLSVECDEVTYQFGQFLDYCAGESDFEDFDPSEPTSRVDKLLYEHMAGNIMSNWLKCGTWLNYCCLCLMVKPQLKEVL